MKSKSMSSQARSKQARTKLKSVITETKFMETAIAKAIEGMRKGKGGPFGAVIVKGGKIISKSHNEVLASKDPTAHAEVVAIRLACKKLKVFQLEGCELYTSCEPCPMCLGAAYWARIDRIVYANTRADAEAIGFGDQFIYREFEKPIQNRDLPMMPFMRKQALAAFKEWMAMPQKIPYGPVLK
jgi:guanine deaminase